MQYQFYRYPVDFFGDNDCVAVTIYDGTARVLAHEEEYNYNIADLIHYVARLIKSQAANYGYILDGVGLCAKIWLED